MKIIELSNLYKYEYNVSDISVKTVFETGDSYNCRQTGRYCNGLMLFKNIDATHYFENKTISFKDGDLCYFPKGIKYKSVFNNCVSDENNAVILNFCLNDKSGNDIILSNDIIVISDLLCKNFREYIDEIVSLIEKNKPIMYVKAKIYELLTEISVSSGEMLIPLEYQKILPGITFIERNYDKNITVADAAKRSFLSESHFRRLFKDYMKTSPLNYINKLRIDKATVMLKSRGYKISEISNAVGIDNPAYFSWFYKNKTGVSPSEYY